MHEAAPGMLERAPGRQRVHESIKHVIADEGSGGLGYFGGDAFLQQGLVHRLDRQSREVGRWPTRQHRNVYGLRPGVVCDSRVVDVDRHALQRECGSPASQPKADHQRRTVLPQQGRQCDQGLPEDRRQLRRDYAVAGDPAPVQRLRRQPAGVGRGAVKSIETCQEHGG